MDFIIKLGERLVDFAHNAGYIGIFIMTFLESTFLPIPSEVTMIPAGYLIYQEEMGWIPVLFTSISGTILGGCFSYYIARKYGRKFILKYSKYFFIDEYKLTKMEVFFKKHGAISTFIGRLIPGIRHLISFPAGLANMDFAVFSLFTALGGGLWVITLLIIGYFIGGNEELISNWLPIITIGFLAFCALAVAFYIKKSLGKTHDQQ